MRALVTGGCGFIGSHIVDLLHARGDTVIVLDNLDPRVHPSSGPTLPEGVRWVRGDVRDPRAVGEAIVEGVDVVFHEAAMVGYGKGAADARAFFDVNVDGTLHLLEALAAGNHQPDRVVLASTMALYGEGAYECPTCGPAGTVSRHTADLDAGLFDPACDTCGAPLDARPVAESQPTRPRTAYAISKLAQEQAAMSVGRDLALPIVALRYHNVYGPRMPRDTPYAGVASLFKSRLLAGKPPLVFEDGRQLRDFVHVEDVARANLLAATVPVERLAYEAFNIGTGVPRPILDLARELARNLAAHVQPDVVPRYRPGDVRHVFASIDNARKTLGYEPQVSFGAGVERFAREPTRGAPAGD